MYVNLATLKGQIHWGNFAKRLIKMQRQVDNGAYRHNYVVIWIFALYSCQECNE